MNKVILMGRLCGDPEVRYTQNNNTLVANFNLAVNRRFAKKEDEKQADFISIVAWGKIAEFCNNYFKKGQQVVIIGRIQTRNYDDNEGKRIYVTEVIAEEVYFADTKHSDTATQDPFAQPQAQTSTEAFSKVSNDELPF